MRALPYKLRMYEMLFSRFPLVSMLCYISNVLGCVFCLAMVALFSCTLALLCLMLFSDVFVEVALPHKCRPGLCGTVPLARCNC